MPLLLLIKYSIKICRMPQMFIIRADRHRIKLYTAHTNQRYFSSPEVGTLGPNCDLHNPAVLEEKLNTTLKCILRSKSNLPLIAVFQVDVGQLVPLVSSSTCSGRAFRDQRYRVSTGQTFLPTDSVKALKETQALSPASGLTSSFLHPPPDS